MPGDPLPPAGNGVSGGMEAVLREGASRGHVAGNAVTVPKQGLPDRRYVRRISGAVTPGHHGPGVVFRPSGLNFNDPSLNGGG